MMNLRYNNNLPSFKEGLGKVFTILCLMMASVGAWAADYVITYTANGTTYYLANDGTNLVRVTAFDPATCIWNASGTIGGTSRTISKTINGRTYYLYGTTTDGGALTLNTNSTNFRANNNNLYYYSRYAYYVYYNNGWKCSRRNYDSNTQGKAYALTTNSVAVNNNGITAPDISCSGLSGSAGIQLSRTGVGGSYIPAHTTYAFNNQTIYYYNNTAYTNTNQFAVSVNANDATYNWSVTAGTANVSTTGVVTLGNNNTQNVTVRCRATINGVNKDATYTLNATATAALNETAYSDIEITPSAQTLDLGEEVTYTVSPSISQVTKTRPQYVSVTDAQGHTHYKVGTTYQAAEPAITETPGAAINFTSFSWSAAEGGAYFTLEPYYSASSNKVTLTRSAQKTGTQQTFTISVTGVYGGQNKTASATVTIPATQVDLTALHAGEAINLGVGSSESINGHYTYEPNYDSAGAPYLKFKYKSNNESVATVDASGKVTAVGPGSTTITVTAVKLDGTDGVTCNVTVNVAIDAPTISIDGSGNVTITHPVPGVQIRYTTDGTNPTVTTGTVYSGTFTASNEQTIKAIAVSNGVASAVASELYATSGVSDSKVVINDYEDHTWTYYQSTANLPAGYPAYLSSPDPRNVKITYRGGSVNNASAVAISGLTGEGQNEMVYYKTLEKTVLGMTGNYPYQVISNPFSKRPRTNGTTGTNGFWGFAGWKIISGGKYIAEHADNDVLGLDEIIHFTNLDENYTPNCKSGEVIFEATWTAATVKTGNTVQSFTGGTYETNFWVITGNTGNISLGSPCTMSARYPDGTSAGNYSIGTGNTATTITTTVDNVKIEFLNLNTTGAVTANGYNFTMGRGITWSRTAGQITCGNRARAHTVKIESGKYGSLYHFTAGVSGAATNQLVILGNDYDRAKNDNAKLEITGQMIDANSNTVTGVASQCYVRSVVKSGSFMTGVSVGSGAYTASYYFGGYGSNNRHVGRRFLTIEGGEFTGSVCGGTDDSSHGATARAFDLRVRGNAVINGAVYGGAENAQCYGVRTMIFTGGTVKGWVCAAANGTSNTNGDLTGTTYLYMGGNARVDSEGSHTVINRSVGGNVFAAGCGYQANNATSGLVRNGTNLVIADNTYIERGAYGGGSYGFSANTQTTNIFITGGHVAGKNGGVNGNTWDASVTGGVYGGACQNAGGTINITMTGGLVEGGLYGGSNVTGTIAGKVTMQIDGGQVGTTTTAANVHGGGFGSPTRVNNDVEISLGKTDAARDADGVTVWGDVYGGSALGYVNGTTAADTYHTNVTMNAGYIHGSLYGGALGNSTTEANVYGPVAVKVYGGSVMNTDGSGANGSGAVYGANNINGAPQRSVTVDIYGTNSAPAEGEYALFSVYGGGNQANYTYGNGYPKVTVHNCDNSIEYVYGGGNAAAVAATDVTIYGGDKIGNVFGGGNGQVKAANVNGNTNVKIYGGTIGDVYGGSNTDGTISGTINVNVNAQAEGGNAACPINIDNVYGGGNKAASNVGNITIGCAEHIGAVYGGANQANVTGHITLNIVSGHIDNVFGGNNNDGDITGNITVNVNDNNSACGMLIGNVYGGGNKADYTPTSANYPVVNILNGHLTGSVFGGGLGETAVVTGNPQVTIGQATGTVTIDGDVYGGGDAGNVVGTPVVTVVNNCNNTIANLYGGGNAADVSGTNVTINGGTFSGMVFGGGHGDKDAEPQKEANVKGDVALTITGGTISKVFAGSNSKGAIEGTANLTVNKGASSCDLHITELYGGGNEAAGNAGTINIKNTGGADEGIGTVYGGANNADITSPITLNITGGNIGDLFGGNNNGGQVRGNIEVNVNWTGSGTNKLANVYGGGNIASIDNGTPRTVTVNIKNASTTGSVFGGGKGKDAVIVGTTNVNIGDWETGTAIIGGDVFGGGDLAAVEGDCNVTIRDCETEIHGTLYGGGNAAPVYSTNTTVWGGLITGDVFGGGNGADPAKNAKGAQVGYKRDDTTAGGTGNATTNIYGGTIGVWEGENCTAGGGVFGGSNTNGDIKGDVVISVEERLSDEPNASLCSPLKFKEIYGAGNLAAYNGTGITFNLGCAKELDEVYGGAKQADLKSDITLNITSGKIKKVFGGNNISGKLDGAIKVQVDETGCFPVEIGDLYLGGNQAAYSVYGYEDDGSVKTTGDAKADPVLNIVSATSIGRVFGGGLGETAKIVGNPVVNVNMIKGAPNGVAAAQVGTIGTIFGGGDAAPVQGNTTINIGTDEQNKHLDADDATKVAVQNHITGDVFGGGLGATAVVTGGTSVTIEGDTSVDGNVYGGGNAAEVEGTTTVKIGKEC